MHQALFYLASSFWAGVVHAATPGHGKTIAAAYIVGARGRPVDAVILGVFVTLSHVSGIVLIGLLASLGSSWLVPARTEALLALAMALLVLGLGLWMLWTQRGLIAAAFPRNVRAHHHSHDVHVHAGPEPHHHAGVDHAHVHMSMPTPMHMPITLMHMLTPRQITISTTTAMLRTMPMAIPRELSGIVTAGARNMRIAWIW